MLDSHKNRTFEAISGPFEPASLPQAPHVLLIFEVKRGPLGQFSWVRCTPPPRYGPAVTVTECTTESKEGMRSSSFKILRPSGNQKRVFFFFFSLLPFCFVHLYVTRILEGMVEVWTNTLSFIIKSAHYVFGPQYLRVSDSFSICLCLSSASTCKTNMPCYGYTRMK